VCHPSGVKVIIESAQAPEYVQADVLDDVAVGAAIAETSAVVNPSATPANVTVLPSIVVLDILIYSAAAILLPSVASAKEHRSREVTRDFQREYRCP
jgi:hypothetical protein